MNTIKCSKCNVEKDKSLFEERRHQCIECCREYHRVWHQENKARQKELARLRREKDPEKYKEQGRRKRAKNSLKISQRAKEKRNQNPEKARAYRKEYYHKNKEHLLRQGKKYRENNKEHCLETQRKNYLRNKEKISQNRSKRHKERMLVDAEFAIRHRLRARMSGALRNNQKTGSAIDLLGCSVNEFKRFIESKFIDGMNWANCGKGMDEWNLDHIKPVASFQLSDPQQQKECFHYTNFQPLWWKDNRMKSDNLDWMLPECYNQKKEKS